MTTGIGERWFIQALGGSFLGNVLKIDQAKNITKYTNNINAGDVFVTVKNIVTETIDVM